MLPSPTRDLTDPTSMVPTKAGHSQEPQTLFQLERNELKPAGVRRAAEGRAPVGEAWVSPLSPPPGKLLSSFQFCSLSQKEQLCQTTWKMPRERRPSPGFMPTKCSQESSCVSISKKEERGARRVGQVKTSVSCQGWYGPKWIKSIEQIKKLWLQISGDKSERQSRDLNVVTPKPDCLIHCTVPQRPLPPQIWEMQLRRCWARTFMEEEEEGMLQKDPRPKTDVCTDEKEGPVVRRRWQAPYSTVGRSTNPGPGCLSRSWPKLTATRVLSVSI